VNDGDQFRRILDDLHDGVYFLDQDRRIVYWNKGAERITGYTADEVLGSRCSDDVLMHVDVHGCSLCDAGCPAACATEDGEKREADIFVRHREGHRVPVHVRVSPLLSDQGEIIGAAETFSDDSPQIAALERLRELEDLVMLDPLTGVGNRRYAEAAIRARLDELRRYGWSCGLLFVDVDHFKEVNDDHGHAMGDRMLRLVAATLKANVRSFDELARYGGEEFVVVFMNTSKDGALKAAEKVRQAIENFPFPNGKSQPLGRVTVSGGVASFPLDGRTSTALISAADQALYQAKNAGRNRVFPHETKYLSEEEDAFYYQRQEL
jgi:diguanylate cyclase (GGDEF)-like protein/PAS domain S-box-containing protein